jgi:hypothetical protein
VHRRDVNGELKSGKYRDMDEESISLEKELQSRERVLLRSIPGRTDWNNDGPDVEIYAAYVHGDDVPAIGTASDLKIIGENIC